VLPDFSFFCLSWSGFFTFGALDITSRRTLCFFFTIAQGVCRNFCEFTQLQLSGWYRPLSHQTFEFILYPFFGLKPVGYRIPVYAIFIANTAVVYALAIALFRRHLAAAIGRSFAIHTTNAFTTYDLGFMPELLYTFLCLLRSHIRLVCSARQQVRLRVIDCVFRWAFCQKRLR
jgi:hypothetical protein